MFDFSDKKVLITGATRGIGRAITRAFLECGATVIGVYGSDRESAERFRQECGEHSKNLILYQCDIGDESQIAELFVKIEERFDTIDILVNNAGIRKDGVVAMMVDEDWSRVIDVNLSGTFRMSKQAVLLMLKQKFGRVITITSPMAYLGFAGQANYAASKAGQIGFTKSLSKEVAKRKITVNCVSPGFIDTDFLEDLSPEQRTSYKSMIPLKRFGKPVEVAACVLFLASSHSDYITGAVIEVNGGI